MKNQQLKKVTLFPFDLNALPLVRFIPHFIDNLKIDKICTYNGSGLAGKDIGYSCNRGDYGFTVTNDFKASLMQTDVLIIPPIQGELLKKHTISKIQNNKERIKEIICLMDLEEDDEKILSTACKGALTKSITNNLLIDVSKLLQSNSKYYIPKAEVIYVGGLLENGDQTEIILSLASQLEKKGKNVACLVLPRAFGIFGFFSYDDIINSDSTVQEKITKINRLIQQIEINTKPDVLIVQVPGTMIKFDDDYPNDYGTYTYMLSQAVQPDYVILSILYGLTDKNLFSSLNNHFMDKFNFNIDAIHLTNKVFDPTSSKNNKKFSTLNLSIDFVENERKSSTNLGIPLFNLIDDGEMNLLVDSIYN